MRWLAAFLVVLVAVRPVPASAAWMRAESPNFIVYGSGSESRLRERIARLEDYDALLRLMTGTTDSPAPSKLHIYLLRDFEELRRMYPVPAGAAGFYSATPYGIAAFVDARAEGQDNEILFHEYAHHFMMLYATAPYPGWYVEGFAEYFATAQFRGADIDIGRFSDGRIYSIVEAQWLPMERLLSGGPDGLDRERMASYYALSWLLTHYFFSSAERQAELRQYLAAAARDNDSVGALQTALGMSPEQLTEALRRYTRARTITYRRMNRETAPPAPPMTITRLPDAADDLIVIDAALRIGMPDKAAAAQIGRIRTLAGRHPDDPYARRVLAHAEALHGEPAAADRLLEALLAQAPDDAELLYLKGMRHFRVAEEGDDWETQAREARRWFGRAHRADENHFQTLYRYALSLRGEANYVSENTANVLLLAHQLAPQVADVRMNAAVMLMNRRDFAGAEYLLRPVAADPHNDGLARAAQSLISEARAAAGRGEGARPAAAAAA